MKLLTAAQMRELDRRAIEELGLPGVVLMENAGRAAVEVLCRRFAPLCPGPVLILAGKGNNGGDGYVMARHLLNRGWQVRTLVLARAEEIGGDAGTHLQVLRRGGGEVAFVATEEELRRALEGSHGPRLLVDALLGTGLTAEVRGLYGAAIDWLNASGRPVLAVDIPSGVDATSGRILGRAVAAACTVSFAFAKLGQVLYPGAGCAGALEIVDIGIPAALQAQAADQHLYVDAPAAAPLLPPRPVAGHKGTFGHLLVVGGSEGKAGAPAMSAEGALRSGAGLVTVAAPRSVQQTLAAKLTEAMTAPLAEREGALGLPASDEIEALWQGKDALALGPGLGLAEQTQTLVCRLLASCPLPVVLDADGLNAVAASPDLLLGRAGRATVLTPHPGEMARLLGCSVTEVEADRVGIARDFARRYGVVLVLKGARTVTAAPSGEVFINSSGNPGLASGGMGDVLTGMIGAFLAQGCPAERAAALAVYLHGRAADRLAATLGDAGMLAGDILRELPATRHELTLQGV